MTLLRPIVVLGLTLALGVWLVRGLLRADNPNRPRTLGQWTFTLALLAVFFVLVLGMLWAMTDPRNE